MRLTITLFIFSVFFISQKNYAQDLKIDKPNFIIYIADDHNYQDYEINGNNDCLLYTSPSPRDNR